MKKTKRILGLDLGTNSIGWALVENNEEMRKGKILGLGSRIIPMDQGVLGKFDSGQSHSQTKERTDYRGTRRLYQRDNLRRERLHRVLNVLDFLPSHYKKGIDFEKKLGQFKPNTEVKLNYRLNENGRSEFIFKDSYLEMLADFKKSAPHLFFKKKNGSESKIPYDWTLYFLRKKALTEKVSKEELSWILLNFNQKRGYYQLRGEEIDSDKNKEFIELEVERIKDTGEEVKGNKLFKVFFSNGWEYDKMIVKTENWVGRKHEFIVTSKTLKSGEIKRTFKTVDSEADWAAIKAKTEQQIASSKQTVGEYIYSVLLTDPAQKIKGKLIKTIERKFYKQELIKILKEQIKHHDELRNKTLYDNCLEELYSRNEAHKNNIRARGFEYLFLEDIIFYQRPLKSKKSTISSCPFESRYYVMNKKEKNEKELIKEPIKVCSKSNPLFQEFRIWQFIQNLKIYKKEGIINGKAAFDIDVTDQLIQSEEDLTNMFDFLSNKPSIEQYQILKFFSDQKLIDKQSKTQSEYRWNYPEDKKYPMAETKTQILSRLKKVKGLESKAEEFLNPNVLKQLWHIIYSVSDKAQYEKTIENYALKNSLDKVSFEENFKKFPPFPADYASYSEKAIKTLLPLMRIGKYWSLENIKKSTQDRIEKMLNAEADDSISDRVREKIIEYKSIKEFRGLPLWFASYVAYNRHSEIGDTQIWRQPSDIEEYLENFKQHSLRNPIVEQVVTETLRVVKDIWVRFGNSEFKYFNEIHIELGRNMKSSKEKRAKDDKRNRENENTNARIRAILNELAIEGVKNVRPFSPSHQEILKIYEEGVYKNPSANFGKVKEEEIDKIRRNTSPSKADISKYKLWLEQGYVSPYTGKTIALSELFTTAYQIEHIIPQSRYFDNSLGNKVICESDVNEKKSNQTAYEFILKSGGSIIGGHKVFTIEQYEAHVNTYFKKNKYKLEKLLSEDIPEGFISRQLNDSRYISKFIKACLSNIVREENEQEATAKNLISVSGAITSKLKRDWGLNDKWNELIAHRFERLNEMTQSNDFGFWDKKINAFRIQVPEDLKKGFSSKRIDHRHHALDALVIACTSRRHIQYLNSLSKPKVKQSLQSSLMIKNEQGDYTKHFLLPWPNFPKEAKEKLETTLISFKQNQRIINKTNNKTWQWRSKNGVWKKILVKQSKGDSWAIRKSLHKETVSGKLEMKVPKGKVATASRVPLSDIDSLKKIDKITDVSIRKILLKHLEFYQDSDGKFNFSDAFSQGGIENMNKNIVALNGNKNHQPIKKVRLFEIGSKFSVGESNAKQNKYVEAAKGTNLFFAVYWNEKKQKRQFESVPLNEVIAHQKQVAHLPKSQRLPIQPNPEKGEFLFSLSPNDLVYLPTPEEQENSDFVNFKYLSAEQNSRIYKMVSSTGNECHFINAVISSLIKKYDSKTKVGEFGSLNKSELSIDQHYRIKEICWKLKIDRLGQVLHIAK